jgi:hypothetical protein
VTVPPQTDQDASTGGTTTSGYPFAKHKRHKGNAVANTDSKGSATTSPTAPVVTGVEPSTSTCDTDGDGVTDPGAPSDCSSGSSSSSTNLVEGSMQPAQPVASPKKKSAGKAKSARSASKKRTK